MTNATADTRSFDMHNAPLRIGVVRLDVRDLTRVSGFYQDILGLTRIEDSTDRVTLGAAGTPLLTLVHKPGLAAPDPHAAGLFHTAFLLPSRADLGRWVAHARLRGVRLQGASDHIVSEAVYLADPEGNGIEVYADRPVSKWRTDRGDIAMATDPLDLPDLLRAGADGTWDGAPAGTTVGHIHLQVGDTGPAETFWSGILGFDITSRYPGAAFFGAGGYHHQVAANVWNSRGAGPRPGGATGLAGFDIIVRDEALLDAIADRASDAGWPMTRAAGTLQLDDPWRIPVTLRL